MIEEFQDKQHLWEKNFEEDWLGIWNFYVSPLLCNSFYGKSDSNNRIFSWSWLNQLMKNKWNSSYVLGSSSIWTCQISNILTCSRHRNLQNIRIRILQIFCYDFFFYLIKSRANQSGITKPQIFCLRIIKKNQNKDLENSNLNILEVPMSRTG